MADRKRPADDGSGDPADDEVYAEALEDGDDEVVVADDEETADEPVSRGGGTAVRERKAGADSPKAKKEVRRAGFFGRIGGFVREVAGELRKVIWPTRRELLTYTGVVIVFVTIITALVAVLDYGFAKGLFALFGN